MEIGINVSAEMMLGYARHGQSRCVCCKQVIKYGDF